MQLATCNWCLQPLKVDDTYDRLIMRAYCDMNCREKDWLFGQWMSDENLNRLIDEVRRKQ